ASMLAGNLLALRQENVKRLLAYSSIAHLGYLLVAFLAGGASGVKAATFYLVTYAATVLGAFGVVTVLSGGDRDADLLSDYRGLAWKRPWLAAGFTAMLLSLAGMPLTAGLIGKFYLFVTGIRAGLWPLVAALVLSSAIGLYYYLRVVGVLYQPLESEYESAMGHPRRAGAALPGRLTLAGGILVALSVVVVLLGVYPQAVLGIIDRAA